MSKEPQDFPKTRLDHFCFQDNKQDRQMCEYSVLAVLFVSY